VVLGMLFLRFFLPVAVLVFVFVFVSVLVLRTLLRRLRACFFGVPRRVPVASAAQEPNTCEHQVPTRRFPR
jgi:hypothetical protein